MPQKLPPLFLTQSCLWAIVCVTAYLSLAHWSSSQDLPADLRLGFCIIVFVSEICGARFLVHASNQSSIYRASACIAVAAICAVLNFYSEERALSARAHSEVSAYEKSAAEYKQAQETLAELKAEYKRAQLPSELELSKLKPARVTAMRKASATALADITPKLTAAKAVALKPAPAPIVSISSVAAPFIFGLDIIKVFGFWACGAHAARRAPLVAPERVLTMSEAASAMAKAKAAKAAAAKAAVAA